MTIHDLYAAYPDGQIDVKAEQQRINQHDRVILQFPFYWYSAPPLLKKWLEEVLTYGWAYGSTGSKLQNKEIMVAVTTRVDQIGYSAEGDVKYTVPELLRPLEATSHFVGAQFLEPFVLYGVEHHSEEQLQEAAQNYVEYALKEC
ncbi:NAD(P)H-dependent oxidoreductase [Enterococcus olivae]